MGITSIGIVRQNCLSWKFLVALRPPSVDVDIVQQIVHIRGLQNENQLK